MKTFNDIVLNSIKKLILKQKQTINELDNKIKETTKIINKTKKQLKLKQIELKKNVDSK